MLALHPSEDTKLTNAVIENPPWMELAAYLRANPSQRMGRLARFSDRVLHILFVWTRYELALEDHDHDLFD